MAQSIPALCYRGEPSIAIPKFNTSVGNSPSNPIIPPRLSSALSIFRDIPDLSSQIKILGDADTAPSTSADNWRGELLNGQQVAIKSMENEIIFLRELYVWSRAVNPPHAHVLPLLGVARLMNSVAFVSPYMSGRSLRFQLLSCSVPDRLRILTEIAGALAFLHWKNIVYGYLSLSTVVLDQNKKAYLSSFYFSDTDWTELVRADWNLYPEVTHQIPASTQRDVFAFGKLIMLVLTKTARSMSMVQQDYLVQYFFAHAEFKEIFGLSNLPEDVWNVARACCEKDTGKRPTMDQVFVRMSKIRQLIGPSTNTDTDPAKPIVQDISSEIQNISQYPIAGGGSCDLYLGERSGKGKVALKLVRLFGSTEQDKTVARRRFLAEVKVWAELHHRRILELNGVCQCGTLSMHMVSPFLPNGNILHYLNDVNPNANRRKLLVEAAEGLVYLHNRDPPVIHGDLKGENILISDSGNAVLADFGLSRMSDNATTSILHGAGSLRWMAPELMERDNTELVGPLRTLQSDVYGYGHVMLEVLSNEKPFFNVRDGLVFMELLQKRMSARPTGPIASQWLGDVSWEYCQQCTSIEPAKRPSMNDVLGYLYEIYHYLS